MDSVDPPTAARREPRAREQGVDLSSVSRAVAALEGELGTRLFQRSTRHLALTEAGSRLVERLAPVITSLLHAEALETLRQVELDIGIASRLSAPKAASAPPIEGVATVRRRATATSAPGYTKPYLSRRRTLRTSSRGG